MNEKTEIVLGNATTIITTISLSLAGLIVGILASHGYNVDTQSVAGVIGLIIMFVFSVINAKFKSTYFTNDDEIRINVAGLTEGQINAIQNFVNNATSLNKVEDYSDDPSLAYDDDGGC